MPIELQQIIQDYARPITRLDWKSGCYFAKEFPLFDYLIRSIARDFKIKRIISNFGFINHAFYNQYD